MSTMRPDLQEPTGQTPGARKPALSWMDELRGAVGREREPASRSYRYLARMIERSYPAEQAGAVMALCSTDGDALSRDVTLMLAYGLQSELDAPVLVIDARAREQGGGLSPRLGVDDRPGYVELLQRGAAELGGFTVSSSVPGIDVLPRGGQDITLAVHRLHLETLLSQCRAKYRYVLLQLGSVIGDTRDLLAATQADAVLLVAEEERTLMREVDASRELLIASGVTDCQIVLAARPSGGGVRRG
jgi:Mrp family chromosome partitioning ATPase